ncbi:hypothetical protein HU200_034097 [Digitaria exilis]|uniref:Bifunctional inhibitor/plant lipid transfer protein/seed storage helical domain-containing protein n=1 Tax=Digitaria exilis TaxID=1010633 RepID=A0A835EK66_9POAL|nr:hypothetical protein HU200_034097 [Digitaria exilis]
MFAVLLILATVATTLYPSSAARVQLAEDPAAPATPQPPAFWRPRVPLPSLPCIPGLPRPWFLPPCDASSSAAAPASPSPPATSTPPTPAECHTSLSGMATSCEGFLTANATDVSPPAAACCDAVKSLVQGAPVCLCHVYNGDLAKIMPAAAHVRLLRAVALPRVCRVQMPFGTLRTCIIKDVHEVQRGAVCGYMFCR